jgi:inner membrane transporter RhtA
MRPSSDRLAVPSWALVVGAIASVQSGAALAATLFARVGPGGAVFLRLLFASVLLLALARPRLRGLERERVTHFVAFGLVLAGMNLSFYEALDRIPLGIAVAIEFVGPLSVAIVGSRRPVDLVWVLLAAGGIIAMTRGGAHGLDGLGIALALLAGCFWGAYILINARVGRAFQGATGLALAMCVGALATLPAGVADGAGHLLDGESLAVGCAIGLLSSAIPYTLELEALRRIAPPVFGVLMSLEPAVAALAGLIVLGQSLAARVVLGIGMVVAASLGASTRSRRAPVVL